MSLEKHQIELPPHKVQGKPCTSLKLCVRKKFRTLPSLEKARVIPNARASSLFLNQYAVILFCTTEEKKF